MIRQNVTIRALRCGSISLESSVVYGGGRGAGITARRLLTREKKRVTVPVYAYLIEHPEGLFLVDCGWCRDISPKGVYDEKAVRTLLGAPLAAFYRPVLPYGEAIHEQLEKLGLRPRDLDCVMITHLDPDHVSGAKHILEARRIILPEDEYFWSCRTVYRLRQPWKLWIDLPLERIFYKGCMDVPNNWGIDVLGDESIVMINLPGHTDGMAGVRVRSKNGFALLCSDAAFCRKNWQELRVPFGFDEKLQLKCLKWIQKQSRDPKCVGIFSSHEPDGGDICIEF